MSTELTPDLSISSLDLHEASDPKPTLLDLPVELQKAIIENLSPADFPAKFNLRTTCHYFFALIQPPTHNELLAEEQSPYGCVKELFACRECLRLRPNTKFADDMRRKKNRAKGRQHACMRFCIDCSTKETHGPGTGKYTRGAHIKVMGVNYVVCMRCAQFGLALLERDQRPEEKSYCQACLNPILEARRRQEAHAEEIRQAAARVERRAWRRQRLEALGLGSEYEDSDNYYESEDDWGFSDSSFP
jgi:hypothetical protein